MSMPLRSIVILLLMLVTAAMAFSMRATVLMADAYPRRPISDDIPVFQRWEKVSNDVAVVDPTQEAVLNYLYSETFAATYRNADDRRVMLSIAYGRDQSDGHDVHKPDLCYPAQGFSIIDSHITDLELSSDYSINVKYLNTRKANRLEPLFYWTTIGNRIYQGKVGKKRAAFEYSLQNLIPDGLIVRVSTIGEDEDSAKRLMRDFVSDWYSSSSNEGLLRFFGKGS